MGVWGMVEVVLDLMDRMDLVDRTGLELVVFLQLLCSSMIPHIFGLQLGSH